MPRRIRPRASRSIVAEHGKNERLYTEFAEALRALVETLLKAEGIQIHSVTCRVKTKQSLSDKLSRAPEKYNNLEDVTDICGVRVITYFPDTVDHVAAIIERE